MFKTLSPPAQEMESYFQIHLNMDQFVEVSHIGRSNQTQSAHVSCQAPVSFSAFISGQSVTAPEPSEAIQQMD